MNSSPKYRVITKERKLKFQREVAWSEAVEELQDQVLFCPYLQFRSIHWFLTGLVATLTGVLLVASFLKGGIKFMTTTKQFIAFVIFVISLRACLLQSTFDHNFKATESHIDRVLKDNNIKVRGEGSV